MSILSLIASRNFISVNKDLMRLLGIEEAILLGELASEYDYWLGQGRLDDGWFFSTVENIEKNTTLTKYRQKKALENLQNQGLVSIKRKGLPAKRYIKINEEKVIAILSNKKSKIFTSGSEVILPMEVKEFAPNKNKDNKNKDNKNNINIYDHRADDRVSGSQINKEFDNEIKHDEVDNGIVVSNSVNKEQKNIVTAKQLRDDFEAIWALYPRKQGKKVAFAAYCRAIKKGTSHRHIMAGVQNYTEYIKARKISQEYIKQGATFFSQNSWEDDFGINNAVSKTSESKKKLDYYTLVEGMLANPGKSMEEVVRIIEGE